MDSSKELVQKAIEFRHPGRIPCNFDSNRTPAVDEKYGEDFVWVFAAEDPEFRPAVNEKHRFQNELGVIFERINTSHGEAREFPLSDPDTIRSYRLPDYSLPARYRDMEQAVRDNPDKYILGMFPYFLFMVMIDLFGFESFMMALYDDRAGVELLADRLTEQWLAVVDCFADRGADGIIAIEDLGLQDRLMVNPELWREIFKPRMAKIVARCHERGLHFHCHTCGGILDIIEDYIEIGVDVLQIDQQDNMGIEELSRRYRGRICFFCPVDIQTTLAVGSTDQVEAKARQLIGAFATDSGGFMAKTYPQPDSIQVPEANIKAMCQAFQNNNPYTPRVNKETT